MGSTPSFPVSDHAAKSEMAGGGVDRLGVACGGTVAAAIVRRAKVRAALDHLAGDFDVRLAGIVACGLSAAARVFRDAASLRRIGLMLLGVPVGGPFPGISDHVVNAVSIRRKRRDRRGAFKTVVVQILPW